VNSAFVSDAEFWDGARLEIRCAKMRTFASHKIILIVVSL